LNPVFSISSPGFQKSSPGFFKHESGFFSRPGPGFSRVRIFLESESGSESCPGFSKYAETDYTGWMKVKVIESYLHNIVFTCNADSLFFEF
jgi:hypothetical protein